MFMPDVCSERSVITSKVGSGQLTVLCETKQETKRNGKRNETRNETGNETKRNEKRNETRNETKRNGIF